MLSASDQLFLGDSIITGFITMFFLAALLSFLPDFYDYFERNFLKFLDYLDKILKIPGNP